MLGALLDLNRGVSMRIASCRPRNFLYRMKAKVQAGKKKLGNPSLADAEISIWESFKAAAFAFSCRDGSILTDLY